MSCLLDRILAHIPALQAEEQLQSATVLNATNVAQYLYETPRQRPWSFIIDFPNIAPPWPNFFVEFDMPKRIIMDTPDGTEQSEWYGPKTFGLHCLAAERSHPDFLPLKDLLRFATDEGLPSSLQVCYREAAEQAHWIANVTMYHEFEKHEPMGPEWVYLFPISSTGGFFFVPKGHADEGEPIIFIAPCDASRFADGIKETIMRVVMMALSTTLLAISFCHCRNVTLANIIPPPKLSKRYQQRHGRPLVRYHVIEIDPVRRILESEGQASRDGLARALHICRGHFKQYQGRGLFGKLQGTYWWPVHVRGNPRSGISLKDYKVSRPDK
jgi:hypothetical protein